MLRLDKLSVSLIGINDSVGIDCYYIPKHYKKNRNKGIRSTSNRRIITMPVLLNDGLLVFVFRLFGYSASTK